MITLESMRWEEYVCSVAYSTCMGFTHICAAWSRLWLCGTVLDRHTDNLCVPSTAGEYPVVSLHSIAMSLLVKMLRFGLMGVSAKYSTALFICQIIVKSNFFTKSICKGNHF